MGSGEKRVIPLSPPDSISHCFTFFEIVVLQRFLCFMDSVINIGTKAGLILHALRQIGKANISDEMIEHIKSQLEEKDLKQIKKQSQYAPAWVAKILRHLLLNGTS